MAGIGDYEEGKPFQLKSGNKTSFKQMGSSPVYTDSPADLNIGQIFKKVHGALTGTEGKEFKDTKFGQAFTRGKDQIKSNVEDDVKGNLFEGVGDAVLNTENAENVDKDNIENKENKVDYSTMNKKELTDLRRSMKEDNTWGVGSDQSSTDIQNKINELYGSSTVHEYTGN